jgi:ATP-dependent protease Clp ATPase subunit
MEQSLIDTMFDLPTWMVWPKVVLDEHTDRRRCQPLLVYREQSKASA